MRSITLPGTSLTVSRFVFGTGSLHHLGNLAEQVAHLPAAADEGFSHFDTAPLYGFGQAEEAIGNAFDRNAPPMITVTTKVGLYPPHGSTQSRIEILGRKAMGKVLPSLSRPQANWAVARARQSLDESLGRLRREHVDLLLLHEPNQELVQTDEWMAWLEQEQGSRISHFGICGEIARLAPFLETGSGLAQLVQAPDSIAGKEADRLVRDGRFPQLTYSYLSASKRGEGPETVLRGALARNPTGAVVVSTRTRSRLPGFAELADEERRQQ